MEKIKIVDLFNVKFEEMENKVNDELKKIQDSGATIKKIKPIGESLNKCSVFIHYVE